MWETRDLALATYLSLTLPIRAISTEHFGEGEFACWWSFDDTNELFYLREEWDKEPMVNAREYEEKLRQLKRSIYRTDAASELITKD